MFLQQIINGLTLGSIYALIALGYTLVYGILLLINFAHSEIFMIGAYFGYLALLILAKNATIASSPAFLLFAAMASAMILTGLLGMLVEFAAYRPLRKASRLAPLISAIGVSIFLQNLMMILAGPESKPFPEIFPARAYNLTANATISSLQIFIMITSLVLMAVLNIFISKTKIGKAMRATSQDMETSRLMGIDVNLIISLTFFIGAALGGAAGVLNGMYYGSIKYNMGFIPGVKAFTAAVLGGIGDVRGAMLGGFMLGILECFGAGYISSQYKDVFAFIILIIVLVFRPQGLFGQKAITKV
ncbi:MAG: branched-chain amino acid ABC transporter permease [bacterium]|nr:branched-chain amino acid ABC transporter permease [bacterium]